MRLHHDRPAGLRSDFATSLAKLLPAIVLSSLALPANAGSVTLLTTSGGAWTGPANTCTYTGISTDSSGNVRVTCAAATGGTPVSGACGSANGGNVTTTPTGTAACSAGSATGMVVPAASGGDYTWTCAGVSGGNPSPTCTAHQTVVNPSPNPPPTPGACATMPGNYTVVEPNASMYGGTWKPDSAGYTYVAQLPAGAGVALKLTPNTSVYPAGFKVVDSTGGSKRYYISRCPGSTTPVDNQDGTIDLNGDARFDNCKALNTYVRWVNTSGTSKTYYTSANLSLQTSCFLPTTAALGSSTPATYYINILNTGATAVGVQYSSNAQLN